jgi:transposase-like protein
VRRRRLTVSEKLALAEEYERTEIGQRAAMCRRRGLNPSLVGKWLKEKREGLLVVADPEKRTTRTGLARAERVEYERQKQHIADLEARLAQAESAVEVLGKASALLQALAKSAQHSQDRLDQTRDQPPRPEVLRYNK